MIIENKTPIQIGFQKRIIKELIPRPQMPTKILAWIIWLDEVRTQQLLDDLEYTWAIIKRVSKDFLTEAECTNIQLIQEELARRLWEDKIKSLTVYDLSKMLEEALERKKKLDWGEVSQTQNNQGNTSYIDKLLLISNTQDNGNKPK